ncbi:FAD/NAD(P)-binding protein [Christiangramia portivictoriae]|uniref:FAD/NAD(P)-binding protein n=1 Tax=Christiangramia portivictoriae TaxID=326069 RepID=UPI0003FF5674|nr:FAD/NAD(P)-binding protein [Christiangramia portivictoriae]
MVDTQLDHTNLDNAYRIAIVGLGPKGLYALERLLAQINHRKITSRVEIHLFNSSKYFGAGDIYDLDQPEYLLMNYSSDNINAWIDEKPSAILQKTTNFREWLLLNGFKRDSKTYLQYAPRALVGRYLNEVYQTLIRSASANVKIFPYHDSVLDIIKSQAEFEIITSRHKGHSAIQCDEVLLTTGHQSSGADFGSSLQNSSKIDFVYPTYKKLSKVEKGTVGIRGFGLTCIDTILELTEGRGGHFKPVASQFQYFKSGNEPDCIYVFSRSGLPMIPRIADDEAIDRLYYFTEANIEKLNDPTFTEDYLPLIKKECYFQYYRTLFELHQSELKFDTEFQKVFEQISEFLQKHPNLSIYSWDKFIDPFLDRQYISHQQMLDYMKLLTMEASKGIRKSPMMSAAGVWRKISPIFNKFYSFGKLDAESHKVFDTRYFGIFNRISYGPPVENFKKLIALGESGLLNFSAVRNSEIIKETGVSPIQIRTKKNIDDEDQSIDIPIDVLIDARIPKGIDPRPNRLYSNLIKNGLLRKFVNHSGTLFQTGGIDITASGHAINRNGVVEHHLSLYGTPTEGVTHDNDTLSRSRNNFAGVWALHVSEQIQLKTTNTF